jgi:hypothetical protein
VHKGTLDVVFIKAKSLPKDGSGTLVGKEKVQRWSATFESVTDLDQCVDYIRYAHMLFLLCTVFSLFSLVTSFTCLSFNLYSMFCALPASERFQFAHRNLLHIENSFKRSFTHSI